MIKNLPESHGENIDRKVNDLFKEGLKLRDINVVSAERKTWNNPEGQSENGPRRKYPDIIIVKLSSKGDSDKVLKSKANVRKSATYKEVFVEPERSRDERIHLANMRLLAQTVGKDKFDLKGTRFCEEKG